MKNALLVSFLFVNFWQAQLVPIKIEDFINQHNPFEQNDAGEVNAINDKEINNLFIQRKYDGFVELTRSIVWDSYENFISPTNRNHNSKFIVQVKVKGIERLKYLEVFYDPHKKKCQ